MSNESVQQTSLSCSRLTLELGARKVLADVDFTLGAGELVGIIGSNGAGKSSLIKTLLGLHRPGAGAVMLGTHDLQTVGARERARRMAYVAQGQQLHWGQSAQDIVALGRIAHQRDTAADDAIVEAAMQQVDVLHLRDRNVQTLSGGERARVLLGRALAVQAPILLADEPLAALDPAHQLRMMQLLQAHSRSGVAVAVVLHDLAMAMRFCSRVVILHEGRKLADAPPAQACSDAQLEQAFGIRVARMQWSAGEIALPWSLCGP